MNTTQRSLQHLRKSGWVADVTERWMPNSPRGFKGSIIRKDLFGFIDILAVHEEKGVLAVQTTVYKSMRERLKKISKLSQVVTILASGIKIEVHGWQKIGGRWVCKVIQYPEVVLNF
jgi:hypothetical protein